MKFSTFILFIGYFTIFLPSSFGNNTPNYIQDTITVQKIDQVDWNKTTKDLDYGISKKPKPIKKTPPANTKFLGWILKIFAIIAVLVMLAFLLYSFVGVQGLKKGENRTFDPNAVINTETVAEHIHEFDLSALIQQAIQQQDYTVATRLYYLLAIKQLSEKDLIHWKKDKTNRNYLNELTNIPLKNKFRNLTNIFERVWYGEVLVDATIFTDIQGQFQTFIDDLK
ncbi:MAG: DUF4129 domain-containing protein [Saprospiraceae bacterium]